MDFLLSEVGIAIFLLGVLTAGIANILFQNAADRREKRRLQCAYDGGHEWQYHVKETRLGDYETRECVLCGRGDAPIEGVRFSDEEVKATHTWLEGPHLLAMQAKDPATKHENATTIS